MTTTPGEPLIVEGVGTFLPGSGDTFTQLPDDWNDEDDEIVLTVDDLAKVLDAVMSSLDALHDKVDNLATSHSGMVEKVTAIIDGMEPHLKEITPLIDAIANNPMFKMFTGTKGTKKVGS